MTGLDDDLELLDGEPLAAAQEELLALLLELEAILGAIRHDAHVCFLPELAGKAAIVGHKVVVIAELALQDAAPVEHSEAGLALDASIILHCYGSFADGAEAAAAARISGFFADTVLAVLLA